MKQYQLFGLVFLLSFTLLCLPSVHGALTDNLFMYYTMNGTSASEPNIYTYLNNMTTTGTLTSIPGVLNNSRSSFTYATNYMATGNSPIFTSLSHITYNFWVNLTSGTNTCALITKWKDPSSSSYAIVMNNAKIRVLRTSTGSYEASQDFTVATNISYNRWVMVSVVMSPQNISVYYNSTYIGALSNAFTTLANVATNITMGDSGDFGANTCGANSFALEEVGLWNRTLGHQELVELYNSGSGFNPIISTVSNVTLLAANYSYGNFTSFSAFIRNGTEYYNYSTTNGIINTPLPSGQPYNITIFRYDTNSLINKTILNFTNSTLNVTYAILNVTVQNSNATGIEPVSLFANGSYGRNITDPNKAFNFLLYLANNATYTINVSVMGYNSSQADYTLENLTGLNNYTFTLGINARSVFQYLTNTYNGLQILAFNASIRNETFIENDSTITGLVNTDFGVDDPFLTNISLQKITPMDYLHIQQNDINMTVQSLLLNYSIVNVTITNGSYSPPNFSILLTHLGTDVLYNTTSGSIQLFSTGNWSNITLTSIGYFSTTTFVEIPNQSGINYIILSVTDEPDAGLFPLLTCPLDTDAHALFFRYIGGFCLFMFLLGVFIRPPGGYVISIPLKLIVLLCGLVLFFMSWGFLSCDYFYSIYLFGIGLFLLLLAILQLFI